MASGRTSAMSSTDTAAGLRYSRHSPTSSLPPTVFTPFQIINYKKLNRNQVYFAGVSIFKYVISNLGRAAEH